MRMESTNENIEDLGIDLNAMPDADQLIPSGVYDVQIFKATRKDRGASKGTSLDFCFRIVGSSDSAGLAVFDSFFLTHPSASFRGRSWARLKACSEACGV